MEGSGSGLLKALPRHFPGGTEGYHGKSQSEQSVSEPRFEPGDPEYKAGVLTTGLRRWLASYKEVLIVSVYVCRKIRS
jgi:hypothetical protein